MFKVKKHTVMPSTNSQETIIAQGVKVEGDFRSDGDVVIDGEVSGTVATEKFLRIGETARIKADVKAHSAVIAGEVQGNVFVSEMLELLATSRVKGDVTTARISVAAGAQVNGKLTMDGSTAKKEDESEE
ncbi:MAG: polymer-forming cytoskeletal protein [Patescibacteria group bacterium]